MSRFLAEVGTMTNTPEKWLGLWGDPDEAERILQSGKLDYLLRRPQRGNVNGISKADVAREIAQCLRRGDTAAASTLIQAGARAFGAGPMTTAVGMASARLQEDAMRAARASGVNGHAYPEPHPDPWSDEDWPDEY
jgi:hypothetical protein